MLRVDAIDAAGYRERILGRKTYPAEQILSLFAETRARNAS